VPPFRQAYFSAEAAKRDPGAVITGLHQSALGKVGCTSSEPEETLIGRCPGKRFGHASVLQGLKQPGG